MKSIPKFMRGGISWGHEVESARSNGDQRRTTALWKHGDGDCRSHPLNFSLEALAGLVPLKSQNNPQIPHLTPSLSCGRSLFSAGGQRWKTRLRCATRK